ncbi:hypothetical protein [Shewanella khirikhana]|uniref:Golvesin/Xly CBD-like domain-containing protein n=1 Tax=Shewanella khirikhana TaxID=1965282 RepID=A0ABN5U033_9GAMM|nr:hypothetical protein [Shewanella khirikhana]AZQ13037.1 hypothetical protein STH12_04003 [Shewanella khirikhana]
MKGHLKGFIWQRLLAWFLLGLSLGVAAEEDTLCAVVKIEIVQELTLERQGFEAIMKINNALEDRSLENVGVEVVFTDSAGEPVVASSDPNHPNASFFIRISSIEGIDNVAGTGELAAASSALIKWLIIPAPGSAGDVPSGTLYYVGAKLNYRLNGLDESLDVAPDTIFVRPMPKLTLDYFLPSDVYADDPLTNEIEPIEPFTLGVRVSNNGKAAANKVKIQSAQPKIVENNQGLAIDFKITDSFVGDSPVTNSLLLDFGDIPSLSSGTGRWIMYTTLSGRFTEFTATFSHADELGGSLTSLIDAVNAHLLLRDVVVDLPGRDTVRDFLVRNGTALTAFESDSVDTPVADLSSTAQLSGSGDTLSLTFAPELGGAYVQLPDPFGGSRQLVQVLRSDGKVLHPANGWLSKHYNKDTKQTQHLLHLFDTHTQGRYLLQFADRQAVPAAPVLAYIPDWTGAEGGQIGFLLEASDPNGDAVSFAVTPMPDGASLTDIEPGKARFNWPIAVGQAGFYPVTVSATDGKLYSNQELMLRVFPAHDTDGDGLDDAWEIEHFGDLSRDGSGDFDGDGLTDREEFELGSDPTMQNGPLAPEVVSPDDEEITETEIRLLVNNSVNLGNRDLDYFFELYADAQLSQLVLASDAVPEGVDSTAWVLPESLMENQQYFWRVRSFNQVLYSAWSNASFKVNRTPEAPTKPALNSPMVGVEVDEVMPLLSVLNSADPDGDELSYRFSVYSDEAMTSLVLVSADLLPGDNGVTAWRVTEPLQEGARYYWQVAAIDPGGLSTLSEPFWFDVYVSNLAPSTPVLVSPTIDEVLGHNDVVLEVAQAVDPEGQPLSYLFELDRVASFDSNDKQSEQIEVDADGKVLWHLSGLLDEQQYFWRVRAQDPLGMSSEPVLGRFKISLQITAPSAPVIDNPGDGSWVQSTMPLLSVHPVLDSDRPVSHYQFEVYGDEALSSLLTTEQVTQTSVELTEALPDNAWAYWRVRAVDSAGIMGAWSAVSRFFVNDKGIDEAPIFEWRSPEADTEFALGQPILLRWEDIDPDSDALISLYYMRPEDAIVLDDLDAGFSAYGDWQHVESDEDVEGFHLFTAHGEDASAQWTRPLEMSGRYEIQVYWPEVEGKYAKDVQYFFPVVGEDGSSLSYQELRKPVTGWNSLGEHQLQAGDFSLFLKGRGHKKRALIADQIRLIPIDVPHQLLVKDIQETPDGDADTYLWDTSGMQPGEYQLFARIADETQEVTVYSPHRVSLREQAYLRLDNQDPTAVIAGDWHEQMSADAVGGTFHQLSLHDGPGSVSWPVHIDNAGWYEVSFFGLPGVDLQQLKVELLQEANVMEVGYFHKVAEPGWGHVGQLWLAPGEYQLRVSAEGVGVVALDAIELRLTALMSTNELVLDNTDTGFNANGSWRISSRGSGFEGVDYFTACSGSASASWRVGLNEPGFYEVSAKWPARLKNQRGARVELVYSDNNRVPTKVAMKLNQQRNGGTWQPLSVVKSGGGEVAVTLNRAEGGGCVVADAIRIRKLQQQSFMWDNSDAEFAQTRGWWQSSRLIDGFIGENYLFSLYGEAKWSLGTLPAGKYRIEARWPASIFHSSSAEFVLKADGAPVSTNRMSQKSSGARWNNLGEVEIQATTNLEVTLKNKGHGFLVADAVRLVRVE